MSTIVHFDITAEDPERAKKFYEELFEWKIDLIPGPENYYLIETKDLSGVKGIGGGIAKRQSSQEAVITNFIDVISVDEMLEKIVRFGGKIIQSRQPVPGFGFLAVCADTEENVFGIFQEDKRAF